MFYVMSVNQPLKHLCKLLLMHASCTALYCQASTSQSHIVWGPYTLTAAVPSPKSVPLGGKTNSGSQFEEPKNKHATLL